MSDMRFDWYGSLDESWLNDLVGLVQETIDQDRSSRGLTPGQKQHRASQETLISQKFYQLFIKPIVLSSQEKAPGYPFRLIKAALPRKKIIPAK